MAAPESMHDVPDSASFSFPAEEERILAFWDEIKAFETQLKLTEGKPEYVFYDGPPFATGLPHYGHILAGTIKDVVTRYACATGHHCTRRFGWDCHGLPVEYEIDKALGIKSKDDVLAMGIDKYNEACRAIVMRYSKEWETTVRRVGRWIDFEHDYKTMNPEFMESVWWVFKTLHEKGLVYRGFKVMPYSTACNTPLSNFEAGLDYRDVSDPAIMVAFPIIGDKDGASLVAWTTTPWTMPSNVALCVHPELQYVRARGPKGDIVVVAEARLPFMPGAAKPAKADKAGAEGKEKVSKGSVKAKGGPKPATGGDVAEAQPPAPEPAPAPAAAAAPSAGYTVLATMKGTDLVGLRYEPIFDFAVATAGPDAFRVVADTYVTADSGTGIVHQAPAFGEDDFRVCQAAGVLPKGQQPFDPTDANGRFTAAAPPFQGKGVKEADKEITAAIKAKGRLVDNASLVHSYPFCWRSQTPLIYKAVPSYFVHVEAIKERLLASNDATYWVPAYVKERRFRNWLENAHDWAVSRNRFWGTPLPVWRSADGSEEVFVGSVEELFQLSGVRVTDLHRHFVDHITIPSQRNPGGPPLRRCEDVFDCWFESGSMPYASVHYPFENAAAFEGSFPADFVAEGLDQTRGWFYTLMVLSTALFDKPAFKNLVCNGLVLAADGKKMSKSLKNYPPPEGVVAEYGADALRLYLVNSPVVRAEPLRFQKEGVFSVVKDVLLKWYNAYRFLAQNARRASAEAGGAPFDPAAVDLGAATNVLDRWVRAATGNLVDFVRAEMAAYRLYTVAPRLVRFIDALCNTYVRLNRARLKGRGGPADTAMALATLYDVLRTLCVLMAPFTPFFTESMFQNLRRAAPGLPASVHFCDFPTAPPRGPADARIETSVGRMSQVIELARTIRERHNRPVKTPLSRLVVVHPDADFLADLQGELAGYVTDEVNVRELAVSTDVAAWATVRAEPNWAALGKRLGKSMAAVASAVKALTAADIAAYEASGSITVAGAALGEGDLSVVRAFRAEHPEAADCDAAGDGDVLVVLRLTVDASLAAAGLAREAAARVQRARKAAGVAAGAVVAVSLAAAGEATRAALAEHAAYLADALGAAPRLAPAEEAAAADGAPGHDGRPVLHRDRAPLSNGEDLVVILSAMAV